MSDTEWTRVRWWASRKWDVLVFWLGALIAISALLILLGTLIVGIYSTATGYGWAGSLAAAGSLVVYVAWMRSEYEAHKYKGWCYEAWDEQRQRDINRVLDAEED